MSILIIPLIYSRAGIPLSLFSCSNLWLNTSASFTYSYISTFLLTITYYPPWYHILSPQYHMLFHPIPQYHILFFSFSAQIHTFLPLSFSYLYLCSTHNHFIHVLNFHQTIAFHIYP